MHGSLNEKEIKKKRTITKLLQQAFLSKAAKSFTATVADFKVQKIYNMKVVESKNIVMANGT